MKIYLIAILLLGATVALVQQRRINALTRDLQRAPVLPAQSQSVRSTKPTPDLTPEQIAQMRADHLELMRLRASISDLRAAAQSPENVEAEIAKLEEETEAEETKARLFAATQQAEIQSRGMQGTLRSISALVQAAARSNDGKIPRNLEELEAGAKDSPLIQNFTHLWEGLTKGYSPFYINFNHFEFIPEAAPVDGALVMRERQPRELPDGQWARVYLTSDFQIFEQRLNSPDFSGWEFDTFEKR